IFYLYFSFSDNFYPVPPALQSHGNTYTIALISIQPDCVADLRAIKLLGCRLRWQILCMFSAIAGAVKLKAKTAKPTNENDFFIINFHN
ncbi:hypothetical protein, partial [Kingella kingae]|uniref:hypothetical protein n=1 Tax=Kingella kingae TaxID=504 RepID=UPI001EE1FE87